MLDIIGRYRQTHEWRHASFQSPETEPSGAHTAQETASTCTVMECVGHRCGKDHPGAGKMNTVSVSNESAYRKV